MGAVTFCPSFPHKIHSVSKYPILNESLYQGPWHGKNIDYCLYPAGLLLDDDEKFVNLLFGYQDKHAFVIKLEVEGLLRSLYFVSNCSEA